MAISDPSSYESLPVQPDYRFSFMSEDSDLLAESARSPLDPMCLLLLH